MQPGRVEGDKVRGRQVRDAVPVQLDGEGGRAKVSVSLPKYLHF